MLSERKVAFYFTVLIGGLVSAIAGIALSSSPLKFLIATFLGLIFIAGLMLFSENKEELLLFWMIFFIPVNVDINLFLHKHIGTSASVAISSAWLLNVFLLLFLLAKRMRDHKPLYVGGELIVLLCYVLWGLLTLIHAKYPVYVFLEVIRLIMLGAILFTLSNITTHKLVKSIILFLLITLLFQSLLACIQYFVKEFPQVSVIGVEKIEQLFPGQKVHRVMGTLGHPNFLGYFLEIMLPVAFAVFLTWPGYLMGILSLAAWLVGSVALIFTKSRGAWISYPFGLAFVVLLLISRRALNLRSLNQLLIVCALTVALLFLSYPVFKKRFLGRDYRAMSVRMPLNKAAFSVFKQFPLLGVGMNNFSEVFKEYDTTGYSRIFRGYKHVVHNMYLLIATETGIIGLLLFLSIFCFPFFYTFRGILAGSDDFTVSTMVGICGGILAHFVHALVDPGFIMNPHVSALMFLLIGWCSGCYRLWIEKNEL